MCGVVTASLFAHAETGMERRLLVAPRPSIQLRLSHEFAD